MAQVQLLPPPGSPPKASKPAKAKIIKPVAKKPAPTPAPATPSSATVTPDDPNADVVFGAYQRGQYKTAFDLATKRVQEHGEVSGRFVGFGRDRRHRDRTCRETSADHQLAMLRFEPVIFRGDMDGRYGAVILTSANALRGIEPTSSA